jgi:hypothetical protein
MRLIAEHERRMHGTARDARYPHHLSPRMRAKVSRKVRILVHEGYPQKQAVAIAYSMCVGKGRR